MNNAAVSRRGASNRPVAVTLLGILFLFLGLVAIGMAVQDLTWNEEKPGKPMDPDLLPWSIGLLCLGGAFLSTAFGLVRMRAWARRSALLFGIFLVGAMLYALMEDAPLLALLFTPGVFMVLGLLYLLRPRVTSLFR